MNPSSLNPSMSPSPRTRYGPEQRSGYQVVSVDMSPTPVHDLSQVSFDPSSPLLWMPPPEAFPLTLVRPAGPPLFSVPHACHCLPPLLPESHWNSGVGRLPSKIFDPIALGNPNSKRTQKSLWVLAFLLVYLPACRCRWGSCCRLQVWYGFRRHRS